jgi:predicted cobalt transporter CbtA
MQGIIDELTETAEEAIEQAAAEAAKAAAMASIRRETEAWAQAQHWQGQYRATKRAGIKTAVLTGVICFLGGLAIGAGGVLIIQGGR